MQEKLLLEEVQWEYPIYSRTKLEVVFRDEQVEAFN
jgi:hypothetical protein